MPSQQNGLKAYRRVSDTVLVDNSHFQLDYYKCKNELVPTIDLEIPFHIHPYSPEIGEKSGNLLQQFSSQPMLESTKEEFIDEPQQVLYRFQDLVDIYMEMFCSYRFSIVVIIRTKFLDCKYDFSRKYVWVSLCLYCYLVLSCRDEDGDHLVTKLFVWLLRKFVYFLRFSFSSVISRNVYK